MNNLEICFIELVGYLNLLVHGSHYPVLFSQYHNGSAIFGLITAIAHCVHVTLMN